MPRAAMACLASVLCLLALPVSLAFAALPQDTLCLQRTLPVTVHDSKGFRLHGLTSADFQGTYRGQLVKILSIRHDDRPPSGRHSVGYKWEHARATGGTRMEDGQHGRGPHRSIGSQEYVFCSASFFRFNARAN